MSKFLQKNKPTPPPRAKGTSAPMSDAVKALQAESMFKMRVEGGTMEEIAKRHKMSVATAYRRMSWAEDQGIVEELRERVRREIAPKALKAYEDVLDLKTPPSPEMLETHKVKLTAAKDITFGSGILTKDTQKARQDVEHLSLDWYYTQSQNNRLEDEHPEGTFQLATPIRPPLLAEEAAEATGTGDGKVGPQGGRDDRGIVPPDEDGLGEEE